MPQNVRQVGLVQVNSWIYDGYIDLVNGMNINQ